MIPAVFLFLKIALNGTEILKNFEKNFEIKIVGKSREHLAHYRRWNRSGVAGQAAILK